MIQPEHPIIEKARSFGNQHLATLNIDNIDLNNHKKLRRLAANQGFTKIEIPKKLGGLGLDFKTRSKVFGILSTFDFGFSMSVINTHSAALRLSQNASPKIIDHFFTKIHSDGESACTAMSESDVGSDFFSLKTLASRVGHKWQINGRKVWIVNGRDANLAIVYAQTKKIGDKKGIAGFAIDLNRDGVKQFPIDGIFSQKTMGTGGFELHNYIANEEELILPPGLAYKEVLSEINLARTYVGSMCCHMLENLISITKSYGTKRKSFGNALNQHQTWRFAIAEAEIDLSAAKLLVKEAENTIGVPKKLQLTAAKAKAFSTKVCQKHFPILLHKMGAEGFQNDYPFSKYIAAVQMASLMDGSNEMLLERISRES